MLLLILCEKMALAEEHAATDVPGNQVVPENVPDADPIEGRIQTILFDRALKEEFKRCIKTTLTAHLKEAFTAPQMHSKPLSSKGENNYYASIHERISAECLNQIFWKEIIDPEQRKIEKHTTASVIVHLLNVNSRNYPEEFTVAGPFTGQLKFCASRYLTYIEEFRTEKNPEAACEDAYREVLHALELANATSHSLDLALNDDQGAKIKDARALVHNTSLIINLIVRRFIDLLLKSGEEAAWQGVKDDTLTVVRLLKIVFISSKALDASVSNFNDQSTHLLTYAEQRLHVCLREVGLLHISCSRS